MQISLFEDRKIANYQQDGEGTPLVFIHGFCEESSVWENFSSYFEGRAIIRIDLPGFGKSEQIDNYSISRYADVVHSVLKDLKIDQCIFIGHSMGGYVGLEFAKKYSEFLKGLCLFHSHPYADTEEKKEGRRKSIEFIQKNGHIHYVKQLVPKLFTSNYSQNNHLVLAKLVFNASQMEAENIIAGLEVMINRNDNTSVLDQLNCPALFIIGKDDMVVPNYVKETARPEISSVHILKNVAHMGMFEAAKKCERIIKDFVKLTDVFE